VADTGGPTRVALLTPPGRGALAVVGVAGPGTRSLLARRFTPRGGPLDARPDGAIVFGRWLAEDGPGEDLVVVLRGPDAIEVHCHGGLAAPEAVIASLERLGAVRLPWIEWLRAGGAADMEVEAREALALAVGPKAARILCRQLAGCLEAELDRIAGLRAASRHADVAAAIDRLTRAARLGLRLTRPWRVVLAGRVNAGKSSLVNALSGHARSIVADEPGTTRDLVETRVVLGGWEVDLIDTAGWRSAADAAATSATERAGIARAVAAWADADLMLHVVDAREPVVDGSWPGVSGVRRLFVRSQADRVAVATSADGDVLFTSAVTGQGIETLGARIVRELVPEEVDDPTLLAGAVPFTPRQCALIAALGQPADPQEMLSDVAGDRGGQP
jgi:tRNA modification GTPase